MTLQKNNWEFLKTLTQARVGLKRIGHAINTKSLLDFQWSHAEARDAIFKPWDYETLRTQIESHNVGTFLVSTQAKSRSEYLLRPDYGRQLETHLERELKHHSRGTYDILILISNGLCSEAVQKHTYPFLRILLPQLQKMYSIPNIFLAENARVALIDDLGSMIPSQIGLSILGERPGLSSSDSMGVYLTYKPQRGRTHAERNCISNIREPHGLSYEDACEKTLYLLRRSLEQGASGITLKEESKTRQKRLIPHPP